MARRRLGERRHVCVRFQMRRSETPLFGVVSKMRRRSFLQESGSALQGLIPSETSLSFVGQSPEKCATPSSTAPNEGGWRRASVEYHIKPCFGGQCAALSACSAWKWRGPQKTQKWALTSRF